MTEKQIAEIMSQMVIVVDTREQKNQHILEYFNEHGIKWKSQKLDFADYGFELPEPYSYLNNLVVVEKKNSIDEINGNFTKGRERFHNEFKRSQEHNSKVHLVVENATWKKIMNGTYRSKIHPNSVMASIITFSQMYNLSTWFVEKSNSPMLIYNLISYGVKGLLKNE